jgi:hypothetical protein
MRRLAFGDRALVLRTEPRFASRPCGFDPMAQIGLASKVLRAAHLMGISCACRNGGVRAMAKKTRTIDDLPCF